MAIVQASSDSSNTFNVRYSAPFGALYVSTPASEDAMATIKGEVGDAAWKKGFSGLKGDSVSSRIRARAKELGVTPVAIKGRLTNARVVMKNTTDGHEQPYLQVTITDSDGRTYLSVGAGSPGAQMLIRKLAHATPGVETDLSMFATYGQNKTSGKWFAEHCATLKQGGAEVRGVDPREKLAPLVQAADAALKAAGVDDKETLSKRRQKVTADFHLALMPEIEARFKAWFEAQPKQQAEQPASTAHGHGSDAGFGDGGFGDGGFGGDFDAGSAGGYDGDSIPVF